MSTLKPLGNQRKNMETETEEDQAPEYSKEVGAGYLLYTFAVGISLVVITVIAGVKGLNFWASIAIMGFAQTLFRIIKRLWRGRNDESDSDSHSKTRETIETWSTLKVYTFLYLAMVLVSALWYGIGVFGKWLVGLF